MPRLTYSEIDQLVWYNNRADLVKTIFIAQIYKESRFDPAAKSAGSTATGLMQMTTGAVTEVNRVKKTAYKHTDMTIAATNIQAGTTYLQILVDRWGGLAAGLDKYGTGPGYSTNILAAHAELVKDPADPMAVLAKFIGKF
jgi:Transglycosylase SLT domain